MYFDITNGTSAVLIHTRVKHQYNTYKKQTFFGCCFFIFFGSEHDCKRCAFVKRNNVRRGNITLRHYRKTLVQLDQTCHVCVILPLSNFAPWTIRDIGFSRPQESPSSPILLQIIVSKSGREALNLSSTHSEKESERPIPEPVRMPAGRVTDTQYPCWEW